MWVKICGITTLEDARCAIDAGADALGFVFYPKSPRYITPENAKAIVAQLPLHVKKIGLFVEALPEEINVTCKTSFMDMAQIHFEVDEMFLLALDVPYSFSSTPFKPIIFFTGSPAGIIGNTFVSRLTRQSITTPVSD